MINKKTLLIRAFLSTGLILTVLTTSACSKDSGETAVVSAETSRNNTTVESQKNLIAIEQVAELAAKESENELIVRAKKVTTTHKLTDINLECLRFELLDELYEGKHLIDVRELHSKDCGGDINTSPRLFSIAVSDTTDEVWSDAKSLLGQLEKLD